MSSIFANWRLVFRAGGALSLTALVLAFAVPVMGQTTLGEVGASYEVALAEHEAASESYDRAFTLYEQAGDRVDMARARQDGDELEDALAEHQERAIELNERGRELSEAATRLNGARETYLGALAGREEQILALLETPRGDVSPAVRASVERALMGELVQVRSWVDAIERAAGAPVTVTLRPVPELEIDPRDSLDDLFAKENLMQDVAARYDAIVVDLLEQVAGLERQLQRAQSFEELRRSVDRFGGAFVPGAALPPPPPADAATPDGAADEGSAVTAESVQQRIEHLRETIALAQRYRDQAQVRAGLFRQQAESMQR